MTENYCRPCIVGENHYKRPCNTCKDRISRAKGIVGEVVAKIKIETK